MLSSSGEWVVAPVLEGALLINLGDMTARWTNDTYKSTVHRVVNRGDRWGSECCFLMNTLSR